MVQLDVVDDILQDSAMEVLREAIPHGGVQHHLPVGIERKKLWIFYQDESIFKAYDEARKRWMAPDFIARLLKKGEGPGIMITAFVNESMEWLKLSNQDIAAFNAKRSIEGKPHASTSLLTLVTTMAFIPLSMVKLARATGMETKCLSRC